VEIHTSAKVEGIDHAGRSVRGISVAGERIDADYILCGADVVVTHNELIEGMPRRREMLNRLEPSLSGMVFLWGIDKSHSELRQHNIIFAKDYESEFRAIFDQLRVPDEPTVYISITSKVDVADAPAGGENWFVLLNMPYLAAGQNWADETNRMREAVFRRLRDIGIDLSGHIEEEEVITPIDFARLYSSNRGSIYGISSNRKTTAFRRPPNRSRDIRGLYFAGGSSHPGGGIPLVLLSGKMAAELIGDAARV
jgi:phytoene desaturase